MRRHAFFAHNYLQTRSRIGYPCLFFLQPLLLTMIAQLSKLAASCVLFMVMGVSQSSNLRGQEESQKHVIDLMDPLPLDMEEMLRDFDPQHRDLKDLTCVDGGDYIITLAGISFGSCDEITNLTTVSVVSCQSGWHSIALCSVALGVVERAQLSKRVRMVSPLLLMAQPSQTLLCQQTCGIPGGQAIWAPRALSIKKSE